MTAAEVSLAEDRTSPLGLWMYADSYLDAASCVMTHSRHPHRAPVYFLYAHAIEFALKAYLRSKALPVEAIEAHEHRLSRVNGDNVGLPLCGAANTAPAKREVF